MEFMVGDYFFQIVVSCGDQMYVCLNDFVVVEMFKFLFL